MPPIPSLRRPPARHSPPSEHNAASLGFPVPPPAPPQIIGEPAAFGGVVYRPFPDPRLVGNSEPLPADRGSRHGVPSPRSHRAVPPTPQPASASPASTAPTVSPASTTSTAATASTDSPAATASTGSTAATASTADPSLARADGEQTSTGRHTVPDELVRSATYRLPADRVFRAKVPEPTDRPALPDEPTTRIWVPKPRQS